MIDANEFDDVTSQLGTSYKKMKEAEKEKNRWKDEFFRMADTAAGTDQPFEHVNKKDGFVYTRQISKAAPSLDDERLREEDPELWEEITYIPEPERVLKPLEELSPEQLAKIGEYLVAGRVSVKLGAPKKAKPEDIV